MADISVNSEDVRILSETGWLAASRGLTEPALSIFEGLIACRPQLAAGYVGQAYALLGAGRFEEAAKVLEKAPSAPEVDLFGGIAKLRLGDTEGARKIFEYIKKYAEDPNHAEIAGTFLSEM